MQQHHGTERPAAKGSQAGKLIKRVFAIALAASVVGVVVDASTMPSVQKQFSGRRARMLAPGPIPVTVAQARIGDVPLYLEGVGTAKARNTVTIRPQVDGRILSISFKEGQEVRRGDVLAKIDPATYRAQLDQTMAKKALDEAELANAHRDLERYTKLGGNIIAQKTIDTQRARHPRGLHGALPADHDDHLRGALWRHAARLRRGTGSAVRQPLGITIIGGLIVSQVLTLYTTPVVYLMLDRLHRRLSRKAAAPAAVPGAA